jgi:TonB-dependent SusC/RagA subfamily outer membrane receptor
MTGPARPALIALLILTSSACASGGRGTRASTDSASTQPTGTVVRANQIDRDPNKPIEEVLQGRVSGVRVSRTSDGGLAIQIRGGSFSGTGEPLFVVDGIPLQAGPNGTLYGINPYDIASIEVLKDPVSLAQYGSRGANGVIVIKTKKPQ